ncbi:MAG: DUF192 domain-containing protein [Rhodospirillales bacterium]
MNPIDRRRFIVLLGTAAFSGLALPASAASPFRRGKVDLVTAKGRYTLRVEIAETPSARMLGLMHRTSMAADAGMWFDFGETAPVHMWMKDTPLSLDMIFLREDGSVAGVAHRTTPFSTAIISSPEAVRYVLEVGAGTAARLGLQAGDRIFGPR